MDEMNDINNSITSRQPTELLGTILYSDCKLEDSINKKIFDCKHSVHKR